MGAVIRGQEGGLSSSGGEVPGRGSSCRPSRQKHLAWWGHSQRCEFGVARHWAEELSGGTVQADLSSLPPERHCQAEVSFFGGGRGERRRNNRS